MFRSRVSNRFRDCWVTGVQYRYKCNQSSAGPRYLAQKQGTVGVGRGVDGHDERGEHDKRGTGMGVMNSYELLA